MLFIILLTTPYNFIVRLVMANQIVLNKYAWLELMSFLGATPSKVLSSALLPGPYCWQEVR